MGGFVLFDFIRRFWVINPQLYFFPSFSGSTATSTYLINTAFRMRAAASVNLSRTFTKTPTSNQKFTFRIIVKKSKIAALQYLLFAETSGGSGDSFGFNTSDQLSFVVAGGTYSVTTTNNFRDPSAFYDIVLAVDTTQATAANRLSISVNGIAQPTGTVTIPQNYSFTALNVLNKVHRIGCSQSGGVANGNYFDGVISDVVFVDGYSRNPSYFGYLDKSTNSWVAKRYQNAIGNNGFYLDFTDITSLTTFGYDHSGNGNHWTINNASLTVGVTYDAVSDTPDNNYATLSPINRDPGSGTPTAVNTLQNGNLTLLPNASAWDGYRSTIGVSSGQYYVEVDTATGTATQINTILSLVGAGDAVLSAGYAGVSPTTPGQTIALAVNFDTGVWTSYVAGVLKNSGTIAIGAIYHFRLAVGNGTAASINFGQRPFTYTPPSGFVGLCTNNLYTPSIKDPTQYFNVLPFSTNGGTVQQYAGLGFEPDLIWLKSRSLISNHALFDSIRGVWKYIQSSAAAAEITDSSALESFDPDGFTLGSTFISDASRIAWAWRASASSVTNNDGTIPSLINAIPEAGFSIVSYTGVRTTGSVGHGLSTTPDLVIVKDRDSNVNWFAWAAAIGNQSTYINFNLGNKSTNSSNFWSSTGITSAVIGLNNKSGINSNGKRHIAYCFNSVPGYSLIDSYKGNGSADGTFVYCGFRPAFILVKRIDATEDWRIIDTTRSPYNVVTNMLLGDTTGAETSSINIADILSNGFKLRNTTANVNGGNYLFYAVAEQSFKFANAR